MKNTSRNLQLVKSSTTESATSSMSIAELTERLGVKWQKSEGGSWRLSKKKKNNDDDQGPGAA